MLRKTFISLLVSTASRGQLQSCYQTSSTVSTVNNRVQSCYKESSTVSTVNNQVCIVRSMHVKARCPVYPTRRDEKDGEVRRTTVPDDKVSWTVDWPDYAPVQYTAPVVLTASWADPDLADTNFNPTWNTIDGKVDRQSHSGEYTVEEGVPINFSGRTGLKGRGVLGRWGPNHAADPVVTRWKRTESGDILTHPESGKPVLEFVSIERKDGGGWAIPGGMVDPGESVSVTLKREFMEEAMDSTGEGRTDTETERIVDQFFSGGEEVYKGYVDDPRNTDNAWMETVAVNFHDKDGELVGKLQLRAGDDAKNLKWQEISGDLSLYASHKDFVEKTATNLKAHW